VDDERVFVTAAVLAEPDMGQSYFLFAALAVFFDVLAGLAGLLAAAFAFFAAGVFGFAAGAGRSVLVFAATFAATAFAGAGLSAATAAGSETLRPSGAFWTSVNRVWSPMV
jgi:hypothetical protein